MFKNNLFNPSVNTVKWCKASLIRAIKTMAQVAGSMLVIGAFNETAWGIMVETVLVAGLASILTSVAGIPEVTEEE
jgi:hypothetical protein